MNDTWSKADLHIHTTYSIDGTSRVADVLQYAAQQTDLRVIAITDHDCIEGALEARRLAGGYDLDVVVGEEVSTAEGHLLALFIEQWLPPGRPAAETIQAVHAQGGLCIPAHPYGWRVPSLGSAGLRERYTGAACDWPVDGVEAFNASLWLPYNNAMAATLAADLGLPACGGSDSHHLPTIGLGYTLFPGETAADLKCAIQTGQVKACGTPWSWFHTAEFVGLWLLGKTQRVLRLSPSSSSS